MITAAKATIVRYRITLESFIVGLLPYNNTALSPGANPATSGGSAAPRFEIAKIRLGEVSRVS